MDKDCEKAFKRVKGQMQPDDVLAHCNPKFPPILAIDILPHGVISHHFADGTKKFVQYASQTLSSVQKRNICSYFLHKKILSIHTFLAEGSFWLH